MHEISPQEDAPQQPTAPPVQSEPKPYPPRPALPPAPPSGFIVARLTWLLSLLVVLLLARYLLPEIAERYQYAVTRGRMRAEYETASAALQSEPLQQLSLASQMISQRVAPSVVHINARMRRNQDESREDLLQFFGSERPSRGQGSGVIVDRTGFILTNHHVIRGAQRIEVTLSDRRRVEARLVGHDVLTDLAVLEVNAGDLISAEWGNSDQLRVGSLVWAMGSPFGLEQSITSGILSAKNRSEKAGTPYQDFLQTDAAVNPGNSGGPLIDFQGRVIGINTAIVGPTYQGISFAIPSTVARRVYAKIRRQGRVARGWLGVAMEPVTEDLMVQLGLDSDEGVYISEVLSDEDVPTPARDAGVQTGDVVIGWNEMEIDSPTELSRAVAATKIGSRAKLIVLRGGSLVELEILVAERPQ